MPGVKPRVPILQRGHPHAKGLSTLVAFTESAGAPRDLVTGRALAVTGAPTWTAGPHGPQVGGFTTGNYYSLVYATVCPWTSYPAWAAVLGTTVSTTTAQPFCYGRVGVGAFVTAQWSKTATNIEAYVESATLTAANVTGRTDGRPHVLMLLSYSAADHRLCFDGTQVASSTTSAAAIDYSTLSLGAGNINGSITNPFLGTITLFASGRGTVPSPASLADDWLSGRFGLIRPRSSLVSLYVPTTGGKIPYHFLYAGAS